MVMVSELRRFRLEDQHQSTARLIDVQVDLSAHDYPPVTHILTKDGALAWNHVKSIDHQLRRVEVDDLTKAQAPKNLNKRVLLHRDVLDALIIDLANQHSLRANDLWLDQDREGLVLRAADVGPWAIVRRLGRGLLGRDAHRHLVDWRDVEFLRGDPTAAREGHDYHRRVAKLQPPEIARLLDAVPYLHAAEMLTLLPDPVAADTLEIMRAERQVQVFDELERDQRVRLLQLMAPENVADLLGRIGPVAAEAHLDALPAKQRGRVVELLRFPENSAGGIMTNDIVLVEARLTIRQARDQIRGELDHPDFAYYVYVVDSLRSRRLQGVVTLRNLLMTDDSDKVADVMQRDLTTLDPLLPASAAARRVGDLHLAALPVVSQDGQVLGVVTADAALLQLSPPSMSGAEPRIFS
jgi:magnesium transporter